MTTSVAIEVIPDAEISDAASVRVLVDIDGTARRLVLDTGGATSGLRAVDLPPTSSTVARSSPGGRGAFAPGGASRQVEVGVLTLGDLRVRGLLFDVEDDPRAHSILGLDVLAGHRLDIRFGRGSVTLDGGAAVARRHPLVRSAHGHPFVRASWGGVETDVLWDSGAEVTVIDEAFAARHAHLLDPLGAADAGDARGASRRVEVVRMAAVTIGGRSFPPSTAVVTPLAGMRRPGEPPLDVILGMPVLRRADWTLHLAEDWWGYPSTSA